MEDVKRNNCDTIITCGAVQSNHCMLTSSAAIKEGLECWIVLRNKISLVDEDALLVNSKGKRITPRGIQK